MSNPAKPTNNQVKPKIILYSCNCCGVIPASASGSLTSWAGSCQSSEIVAAGACCQSLKLVVISASIHSDCAWFGRELHVDHLAHGQSVGVDPNFATAGHIDIGTYRGEVDFVGQFAFAP